MPSAGPQATGNLRGLGTWTSGAVLTNPADQTVLVDTLAITPGGEFIFAIYMAGSVAMVYDVQLRDAANATTLNFQRSRPAAGNDYMIFPNKITLTAGQRIRCLLQGAIVGEAQGSIFLQELA